MCMYIQSTTRKESKVSRMNYIQLTRTALSPTPFSIHPSRPPFLQQTRRQPHNPKQQRPRHTHHPGPIRLNNSTTPTPTPTISSRLRGTRCRRGRAPSRGAVRPLGRLRVRRRSRGIIVPTHIIITRRSGRCRSLGGACAGCGGGSGGSSRGPASGGGGAVVDAIVAPAVGRARVAGVAVAAGGAADA